MFFRIKDRYQRTRFNLQCRDIFRTPPLLMRDAELTFISQVSHRDLAMYLIAVKSMYRFFSAGKIVVLDDGTLTERDRAQLKLHLPFVRFFSCAAISSVNTPKGGCWERLLLIAQLVREDYVIQVDSDSLTLNEIPEVWDFVSANRSFTLLGAGSFPGVESMSDASERAKRNGVHNQEPQAISERCLNQFPGFRNLKYVRGNAAFAGFARRSFATHDVEDFSRKMQMICGSKKWHEWGSEQVTSNLVIANSTGSGVLPHPKYTSYYAVEGANYADSSFVHFMGGHRFENGCYSQLANQVIHEIRSPSESSDGHNAICLGQVVSRVAPGQGQKSRQHAKD